MKPAASGAGMPGVRIDAAQETRQKGFAPLRRARAGSQNRWRADRRIHANCRPGWTGCRCLPGRRSWQLSAADADGQDAGPANVGDGVGNLPVQVAAPAAQAGSRWRAPGATPGRKAAWADVGGSSRELQFVDPQPHALLGDQGRHLGDAQAAGQQAVLVVVDGDAPGLHQVHIEPPTGWA